VVLIGEEHAYQDRHGSDQKSDGQVGQPPRAAVTPLAVRAPAATKLNQATALSVSRSMTAAMAAMSQSAVAIHMKSL
jgi:hypothetical protein